MSQNEKSCGNCVKRNTKFCPYPNMIDTSYCNWWKQKPNTPSQRVRLCDEIHMTEPCPSACGMACIDWLTKQCKFYKNPEPEVCETKTCGVSVSNQELRALNGNLRTQLSVCQKELAEAKQALAEKDKEIDFLTGKNLNINEILP